MSRMTGPTKAAPLGGILFYGDPHGEWRPLVRAVLEHRPAAVVILGDCGLDVPLRQKLASV